MLVAGSAAPAFGSVSLVVSNPNSTAPLQLCAGGVAKTFTATASGVGSSTYTETQSPTSPTGATLSPNTPQTVTNGAGSVKTYTLTPTSATSNTTIPSIVVSLNTTPTPTNATEFYSVNGPLSVTSPLGSPPTLTFDGASINGTQPLPFTVSDPGPPLNITATLGSAGVASFTSTGATNTLAQLSANGSSSFSLYPLGSTSGSTATATITLADQLSCPTGSPNTVAVRVIPGTLSLSTTALTFSGVGTGSNQTFTAQEYNYTGTLTATSSSTTVATISPASTTAPGAARTVTYTVTPVGYGKSTITITDARPSSHTVSVLVSGGTISASGVASFGNVGGGTDTNLPASPVHVTGSVETTQTGAANVFVHSPSDIVGTSGGSLKISYLTYNCTSNNGAKNQGGTFATGFLPLSANKDAANCLSFGNSAGTGQFADLDFNLNLFLDDRQVPADTYNSAVSPNGHFTVTLSAT